MKFTFTDGAKAKVRSFMESEKSDEAQLLRIVAKSQGLRGYAYQFFLDEERYKRAQDEILEEDGFRVLLDPETIDALEGAKVDWLETVNGSGFHVDSPKAKNPKAEDPLVQKLLKLIDDEINPGVASHGGHVELIDVIDNKKAVIQFGGGCQGCGQADVTLKHGIEARIREVIPEIEEVVDSTDHGAGENPFIA